MSEQAQQLNQNDQRSLMDCLTARGVMAMVSVGYWRAETKLLPEDLGLRPGQVDRALMNLGRKSLLPDKSLQQMELHEGRARATLANNAKQFMGSGTHYVPNGKLAQVQTEMRTHEAAFFAAGAVLIERYPDLREQGKAAWVEYARANKIDEHALLARITPLYPTVESLRASMSFRAVFFQLSSPELSGAALVEIGDRLDLEQARRAAAANAEQQIKAACGSFITESVTALRAQTVQLVDDMLKTIRGSEQGVHQRTLNRLKDFIGHFQQMNFAEDVQMEQQLDRVRGLLNTPAVVYRDDASAKQALMTGLDRLRNEAHTLATQPVQDLVATFGMRRRTVNVATPPQEGRAA